MSNRLDQEREKELQPKRMEHAAAKLKELGIDVTFKGETTITFVWKGKPVHFFPYSGWHSGASIKDGRGLQKLLSQLKQTSK